MAILHIAMDHRMIFKSLMEEIRLYHKLKQTFWSLCRRLITETFVKQRTLHHHPWQRSHRHHAQLLAWRRHKGATLRTHTHTLPLRTLMFVLCSGHCGNGWRANPWSGWPGKLWYGHSCGKAGALHCMWWRPATAVPPCAAGCWHWQPGLCVCLNYCSTLSASYQSLRRYQTVVENQWPVTFVLNHTDNQFETQTRIPSYYWLIDWISFFFCSRHFSMTPCISDSSTRESEERNTMT